MSVFINRISLKSLGPINSLNIDPRINEAGRPVPVVLVGQNGAGKSLVLSSILDAIVEARRQAFRTLKEVDDKNYLRLSLKTYVSTGAPFSHAHVTFEEGEEAITFDEVVSTVSWADFQNAAPDLLQIPGLVGGEFEGSGFFKTLRMAEGGKNAVRSLPFSYFPFFRYELPAWLSQSAKIEFAKVDNWYGAARDNIVKANILATTARWVLDLVLDRQLYEIRATLEIGGAAGAVAPKLVYDGPNNRLLDALNKLLTSMMKAKDKDVEHARLGVAPKGNRSISIHVKRADQPEAVVANDLALLSSGEAMCLSLAAEIIRSHELLAGGPPQALTDVKGVVLIDEIDLHLHIDLQRTVLPALIRQFPSVQFIVTTHSPFFLLGMAETGEVDIYSLPIGNKIVASEFKEFQIGYETFVAENQRFKDRFDQLSVAVANAGKPILITEGKTDWQHLKLALGVLQAGGQFAGLDVDFLEFGDELDMGDTKLKQMCEHFASVPQARTMIFVFDRDNAKIVADMSGGEDGYRKLSDRVYSFCIPKPPHRENYEKVSIEFYYTDDEIRSLDPATNRRLWFTNELRGERDLTTGSMTFRALAAPIAASEFQKSVYDKDATGIVDDAGNSVGMSKAAFVATILEDPNIGPGIGREPFAAIFQVVNAILGNGAGGA